MAFVKWPNDRRPENGLSSCTHSKGSPVHLNLEKKTSSWEAVMRETQIWQGIKQPHCNHSYWGRLSEGPNMDTQKVPRYSPRPTPMTCATAAQMIDHLQCTLLPGVGTTSLFLRKFLRNAEMKKEQRGEWTEQRIHRELQWNTVAKRAGEMQPSG